MTEHKELIDRADTVADTLTQCAPYQESQALRTEFEALGRRLAELVAIGRQPGGAVVVAQAIKDTFREVDQMADGIIRRGKH